MSVNKKITLYKGIKNDIIDNKLRWDLMPLDIVENVVEVYTAGSKKYGENNWQLLENGTERCYGALMRHLAAWRSGEHKDPETGCYHLAQVAWNAFAMLWYHKNANNLNK